MLTRIAAALATVLLTCAPAAAQLDTRTIPQAQPLTGTERMPAVQGSGCTAKTTPCASVAVTPALISTFLAPVFQPLDTDLSAIAALTTADFGRQLLTKADAASTRSTLGAAASGANTEITSITGSAARLTTARTIAISGAVTGTATAFDGTAAITVPITALNVGAATAGTLPVARGGTGDTGTAWITYTPTVTASSGTLTTVSADGAYRCIGKTCFFEVNILISANGTGAGRVTASLPFAARRRFALTGREIAATGVSLVGSIDSGSTMDITTYTGAYPGGSNYILVVSGTYEIQ